jgi:hypothetical protein
MNGKIELPGCIKFRVKLVEYATKTLEMFREAFGKHSLSRTWLSRFKVGRVSVEDERSGRPSTSKTTENVEKIRELIHEDRR